MDMFPEYQPQATRLMPRLKSLADRGIYFGTSSWKYYGWLGSIYSADRYVTRGKLSKAKFEQGCLEEYAEIFPTVCGDLTFYQFPTEQYWAKLFNATPKHFIFGFKVPEDITVETWPKHARYGKRAGLPNEHFLDAKALAQFFTSRLKPYGKQVGPLIFEFGTFNKKIFRPPADFLAKLDPFLKLLPEGFRYAIEIRNQEYLRVVTIIDVNLIKISETRLYASSEDPRRSFGPDVSISLQPGPFRTSRCDCTKDGAREQAG
jgi:uncharacterized protein YecE (DUF72 family)